MKRVVVAGFKSDVLARSVAKKTKSSFMQLTVNHFPDGELYLRFPKSVNGKEVVYIQYLQPNPNLASLEAFFALRTLKELKAKSITFVAPYMTFMRQDVRFHPGECVSSHFLNELFGVANKIITIDPHLHRYRNLSQVFNKKVKKLTANDVLADNFRGKVDVVIGPDWESFQWAEEIAREVNAEVAVFRKKRFSSRHVKVVWKGAIDIKGKRVVIVDDVISTGRTIIEAIKLVKQRKPKKIIVAAVHGVFAENALEKIKKAGASQVITTNTIVNRTAKMDISRLIADAL